MVAGAAARGADRSLLLDPVSAWQPQYTRICTQSCKTDRNRRPRPRSVDLEPQPSRLAVRFATRAVFPTNCRRFYQTPCPWSMISAAASSPSPSFAGLGFFHAQGHLLALRRQPDMRQPAPTTPGFRKPPRLPGRQSPGGIASCSGTSPNHSPQPYSGPCLVTSSYGSRSHQRHSGGRGVFLCPRIRR